MTATIQAGRQDEGSDVREVDRKAHELDWEGYTGNATDAAEAIAALWERLQADADYRDRTVLLVTTDHGRHLEGVEDNWVSHGCSCRGCRRSFLLAVGPGIREGLVSDEVHSSLDLAPTVAHLLDLPFPYHRGRVLTEILTDGDDVSPGPGGHFEPILAGDGSLAVRVSEWQDPAFADAHGGQRVVVELSEDQGESWTAHLTEPGPAIQRSPAAWTDGDVVVTGWIELAAGGEPWTVRLRRLAPEDDDWVEGLAEPMLGASTPAGNLVLTLDHDGVLWLFENNSLNERVRIWTSGDRGDSWSVDWTDHAYELYFPRDARTAELDGVWLLAYSAHAEKWRWQDELNDNTEIYWLRSEDGGASWEGGFRVTDDDAPSIQPALTVDRDGTIHLVWADRQEGAFQLFHATSTDDGMTFSPPEQLTSSAIGAWEPTLAVDEGRVHVAWSEFSERDRASVRVAILDEEGLVDEQVLAEPDGVARTPALLPFGDCRALLTWSESDLQGPWELESAVTITGARPASGAAGELSPQNALAGGPPFELTLSIDLVFGPDDLGLDRIHLELPGGFEIDGSVGVDVDGDPVGGAVGIQGEQIDVDLDESVAHGGAQIVLRMTGVPPDEAVEPGPVTVMLGLGEHPCETPVDGDLLLGADGAGDDDDDDDDDDAVADDDSSPGGDTGEPEDCQCDADGRRPANLPLIPGLLALAVGLRLRGRPGSRNGSGHSLRRRPPRSRKRRPRRSATGPGDPR